MSWTGPCRGHNCECSAYVFEQVVAKWNTCTCKHSEQTHVKTKTTEGQVNG